MVGPRRDGRPTAFADVVQCLHALTYSGTQHAFTAAMSPRDGQPFFQAGFELHERLHLLSLRLDGQLQSGWSNRRTFRGRPWHLRRVLDIDQQAFDPFWRFDDLTLKEARQATPVSRYRVVRMDDRAGGSLVGYAVTGRAGPRGYLQRLAVDPAASGRGFGTLLVDDALSWLSARGVHTVMVNTQETNDRALELYRRIGFVSEPEGLVVLRWSAA